MEGADPQAQRGTDWLSDHLDLYAGGANPFVTREWLRRREDVEGSHLSISYQGLYTTPVRGRVVLEAFTKINLSLVREALGLAPAGDSKEACTGNTYDTSVEGASCLTVEDLKRTVELIRDAPPVPVAIWLIDRPEWWDRVLELVDRPGENWASGHIHSWGGIGVNNVRVKDVELAWHDWARRHDCDPAHPVPFPPAIPGIWIEMNKGPHIRILENHLGNGMVATLERDSLPLPKTIGEVKSERDDSAVPTT